MTTQTKKVQREFAVVVREIAQGPDGKVVTVDIPELKSDYPTRLNVPEEDAKHLELNKSYNMLLSRGNLKKNKDGQLHDGAKLWMYYWNYVGRAEDTKQHGSGWPATEEPDEEPEKLPPASKPITTAFGDAKQASIESQAALKEARLAAEWLLANAEPPKDPLTPENLRIIYARHVGWFHAAFTKLLQGRADQSKLD